jgi:hypothetical protein
MCGHCLVLPVGVHWTCCCDDPRTTLTLLNNTSHWSSCCPFKTRLFYNIRLCKLHIVPWNGHHLVGGRWRPQSPHWEKQQFWGGSDTGCKYLYLILPTSQSLKCILWSCYCCTGPSGSEALSSLVGSTGSWWLPSLVCFYFKRSAFQREASILWPSVSLLMCLWVCIFFKDQFMLPVELTEVVCVTVRVHWLWNSCFFQFWADWISSALFSLYGNLSQSFIGRAWT